MVDTEILRGEACDIQWASVYLHNNSAVICYSPEKGIYVIHPALAMLRAA